MMRSALRYLTVFVASGADRLLGSFGQLVLAPLLISRLGIEAYGQVVLFGLVVGAVMAADFGMQRSVQRFVADEQAQLGETVIAGYALGLAVLGGLLCAVLLSLQVLGLLSVLVACTATGAWFQLCCTFGASILQGRQAFVAAGTILACMRLTILVAMGAAALTSSHLPFVLCAASLPIGAFALVILRRAFRSVGAPRVGLDVARFRAGVAGFAGWAWGQNLVGFASANADRFIVSFFLGTATLAIYNLAWAVSSGILQLCTAGTSFLLPQAARSASDPAAIRRLYRKAVLVMSFASLPLLTPFLFAGDLLLTLWLGEAVAGQVEPFLYLALSFVPLSISSVASQAVLNVTGRARALFLFTSFSQLLVLAASVAGFLVDEAIGMLAWRACAIILVAVVLRLWCLEMLEGRSRDDRRGLAASLLPPTLLAIAFLFADPSIVPVRTPA